MRWLVESAGLTFGWGDLVFMVGYVAALVASDRYVDQFAELTIERNGVRVTGAHDRLAMNLLVTIVFLAVLNTCIPLFVLLFTALAV